MAHGDKFFRLCCYIASENAAGEAQVGDDGVIPVPQGLNRIEMYIWRAALSERGHSSLMEIRREWSIDDLIVHLEWCDAITTELESRIARSNG